MRQKQKERISMQGQGAAEPSCLARSAFCADCAEKDSRQRAKRIGSVINVEISLKYELQYTGMDEMYGYGSKAGMSPDAGAEFLFQGLSVPGMCKMYGSDTFFIYSSRCIFQKKSSRLDMHSTIRHHVSGLVFSIYWFAGVNEPPSVYYRADRRIWNFNPASSCI